LSPKKSNPKAKAAKVATKKFTINTIGPSQDKVFNTDDFIKFLIENIKVEDRKGNLGDNVKVEIGNTGKIEVVSHVHLSGRYLKYLTKKFLKRNQLRDWLRVISTAPGSYEVKFYNVARDNEEEEDD